MQKVHLIQIIKLNLNKYYNYILLHPLIIEINALTELGFFLIGMISEYVSSKLN